MAFVRFMGWTWPDDSTELLRASINDVQAFRDSLLASGAAPKDAQPTHLLTFELL
jgi:hypothetical protein